MRVVKLFGVLVLGFFVLLIVAAGTGSSDKRGKSVEAASTAGSHGAAAAPAYDKEEVAINGQVRAKRVILDHLKAPSTADFHSVTVKAVRDDFALVHVVVDAQNSFGAMLRNSYCVVVRHAGDISAADVDPRRGVAECRPTEGEMLALMERNRWPGTYDEPAKAKPATVAAVKPKTKRKAKVAAAQTDTADGQLLAPQF